MRLRDWHVFLAPHVIGAPEPAIDDALRDAAADFCRRTRIVTAIIEGIDVPAGREVELAYDDEPDLVVACVLRAWVDTRPVASVTEPELDDLYPSGYAHLRASGSREVTGWYSPRPDRVRLVPLLANDAMGALTVKVALQPSRTAETMPDVLFEHWIEPLAQGAAARLHAHHNAPYADPSRIPALRGAFEDAVHRASPLHATGHNRARLRVLPDRSLR